MVAVLLRQLKNCFIYEEKEANSESGIFPGHRKVQWLFKIPIVEQEINVRKTDYETERNAAALKDQSQSSEKQWNTQRIKAEENLWSSTHPATSAPLPKKTGNIQLHLKRI